MRASIRLLTATLAAATLVATPALAQKSKGGTPPVGLAATAIEIVEVCENFARGDVLAVDDAIGKGWDAYEGDGESPYVRSFNAHKELPGIGPADIFVLFETYPTHTLGYCRMDVIDPQGTRGNEAIQAIQNLDRYEGQSQMVSGGSFASLTATGGDTHTMLLTHWAADAFVVQLTLITPQPADD